MASEILGDAMLALRRVRWSRRVPRETRREARRLLREVNRAMRR